MAPMKRGRDPLVRVSLLCFLLLTGLFPAQAAVEQNVPTAIMTDVRGLAFADRIEYTVFITGIFHTTQTEFGRPLRLALDLEPVENRWAPTALAGQAFGVRAVRVSQVQPRIVRLEFELVEDGPTYGVKLTGDGLKVVFFKGEKPSEIKAPVVRPEVEPPAERIPVGPARAPAVQGLGPVGGLPSILIGASAAYQSLSDPRFLEIFDSNQGFGYGLDFVLVLVPMSRVRPAIGVDYQRLVKSGASSISQTPTELILEPITVSAFLLYDTRPVAPYIGVGVCFYHYGEKSALHDTDGSATGVSLQAGLFLHFGRQNFFKMKVFGRWTKVTALENDVEFELGGTALGLTALFGFL